jgi:hypothetical protein
MRNSVNSLLFIVPLPREQATFGREYPFAAGARPKEFVRVLEERIHGRTPSALGSPISGHTSWCARSRWKRSSAKKAVPTFTSMRRSSPSAHAAPFPLGVCDRRCTHWFIAEP